MMWLCHGEDECFRINRGGRRKIIFVSVSGSWASCFSSEFSCAVCVGPDGPRQRSQHLGHHYQWHADHHDNSIPRLPPGYVSARALAINNLGQVVGMATDASFALHRVIWDGGTFIELPNFDPSRTAVPEEISDRREVVGTELVMEDSITG